MKSLDEYLADAEQAHGHLCAGQVLGVRHGNAGTGEAGTSTIRSVTKDRKRLVTFVEIDRCATDAIGVVTGCRLGNGLLKFRDWGKMAATFVDVSTGKAIRIAAKESSKQRRPRKCIPNSPKRTNSRCWPIAKWTKTIYSQLSG